MSESTLIMGVRWEYQSNGDCVVVAGKNHHVLAFVFMYDQQSIWLGFIGEKTETGIQICKKRSREEAQQGVEVELNIRYGPIGEGI